ncbi:MAG TPA: hypothetical protein V6D20_18395 [Candidatus Obscuribacterales bacterium]
MYAELAVRDKMQVGLKRAEKRLTRFAGNSAKLMGAAAVAGSVIMAKEAISAASDMEETVSKSNTIFGESAKEMEAWGATAAKTFGQSKEQAMAAAATMGNLFVSAMGLAQDEAAGMSREMVELASDLASFNNTEPDEAIMALSAALRGESEPIRRYGVLLDDATLKAKALEMGLYKGKGALDPTSKAMAAYQVILEQTTTAQGDFARTQDGLANSQRTLGALWSDMLATMGEGLLPVMQDLVSWMKQIDFDTMGQGLKTVSSAAADTARDVGNLASKFGDLFEKFTISGRATMMFAEWANQGYDQAANAPFFRDFAPGMGPKNIPTYEMTPMPNIPFRDGMGTSPSSMNQLPDYLKKGADVRARMISDAKEEHAVEMALLDARLSGDKKHLRNIEESIRLAERVNELKKQGFNIDQASQMALAEADKRSLLIEQERAKVKEQASLKEQLDRLGGMDIMTAEVNSMQKRGLGMGRMDVSNITKSTLDVVKNISDKLTDLLNREPAEGTF